MIDLMLGQPLPLQYDYFSRWSPWFVAPEQLPGETITIWLGVLLLSSSAFWLTRSWLRAALALVSGYLALQFVMTLPCLMVAVLPRGTGANWGAPEVVMLVLSFICLVILRWRQLGCSLRRVNHALPFATATAIGARLSGCEVTLVATKSLVTLLAFTLIVAVNDWYDRDDDVAGGSPRPMEAHDAHLMSYLQVLLGLSVACYLSVAFVGIALFFAVGLAYHHPAVRLKRWLGLAYLSEALWGLGAFLIGALAWGRPALLPGPIWKGLWFVPLGFFLSSPFKDYKDIEADRLANVRTLYTELSRMGLPILLIHRLVVVVVAGCLLVPAFWLGARGASAAQLALLLGIATAAVLALALCSPKVAVERALWWIGGYLLLVAFLVPTPTLTIGPPAPPMSPFPPATFLPPPGATLIAPTSAARLFAPAKGSLGPMPRVGGGVAPLPSAAR